MLDPRREGRAEAQGIHPAANLREAAVHELLHFSVPHHGKLWKSLMRAHLGDYEDLDRKLKRYATRRSGRAA